MSIYSPQAKSDGRVGLIVAGVIAFVWAAISAQPSDPGQSAAYSVGYFLGSVLIVAAIVWLVLYLTYARRKAPGRGLVFFAILAVAAIGGHLIGPTFKNAASGSSEAEMKAQMPVALNEIRLAMDQVSNPNAPPLDTHAKATGDMGEMETMAKVFYGGIQSDQRVYRDELAKLEFPAVISPARLGAPGGIVKARIKISAARALVEQQRGSFAKRTEEFTQALKAKRGRAAFREMLRGVEGSSEASQEVADQMWSREAAILAECAAMVDDLGAAQGKWRPYKGMIAFDSQADLAVYDRHTNRIKALAKEEEGLRNSARAKALQAFDKAMPSE